MVAVDRLPIAYRRQQIGLNLWHAEEVMIAAQNKGKESIPSVGAEKSGITCESVEHDINCHIPVLCLRCQNTGVQGANTHLTH